MKFSIGGKKMILLDTSFLIAHYNDKNIHHTKTRAIMEEIKQQEYGEVYITDYIFDECATILPLRLKDAKLSEQALILIKDLFLIHIDEIFFEETWQIFKAQKEIKLSFTDCSSIASIQQLGIKNIATFDKAFAEVPDIAVIN